MSNRKYQYGTVENQAYLTDNFSRLLEFGRRFPSPGGSAYYLGDDGTPWKERPRETWITARMAHVYSIGAMKGYEGAAELAEAAIRGLSGELKDTEHGGWYCGRNADGTPLPNKLCYQHAFVILAATSGVLAGVPGAEALLEDAKKAYDRYFWNEEEGLSCDTWNTELTACDPYRGLNANMHTVEAFLAVADTCGEMSYRVRAGRIIDHVIGWASEHDWRIPEHFSDSWVPDLDCNREHPDDPFKPFGATPGHGIEWSRLITQWALSMHQTEPYIPAAEQLFRRAIEDAWNADGGRGIVYTTDWDGTPVVHDRMHWTLMEAIGAAAVLYVTTGKEEYAIRYAEFMQYMDEVVQDHERGSFYHQLDRDGNVLTSVWPGKSDLYHAAQAQLIPYLPANISIAKAVHDR